MRWHANNINRIVKNTVYIGKRHFTFYEPDPANPKPAYKRTDRHILTEFEVELPELRIVDDETFAQANAVIENRHLNKNVGDHRENLLKTLLICGECGSRFCTALSTSGPTYKCAAKIKRGCTPRTCLFGADVQQSKLDGLVIKLALLKEYVHEYIESITLYKPSPLWVLVVVRFVDGSERWGTIKNVRYAKKEVKRDGEYRYTMGFSGWFINNDRHTLFYDKTTHTITEKQTEGKKTYTFEEFDIIVQERKQTDFFEPYVFDVR